MDDLFLENHLSHIYLSTTNSSSTFQQIAFTMNTNILLIAGFLAFSANASAQSSITLFGVLDEGLNLTSNTGGSRAYQMASDDVAISRWGLKGTEDLGGGLNAIFDLESGFNVESGTLGYGGRLFGYQSYVGLQSDTLGSITIGRQFDSISDTVGLLTANGNWAGFLFSHPLDNDNTDSTYHANNSIKFTSNTYGGLSGTILYGFSNQPGSFAKDREFSMGMKYSYNTLSLAVAFANLSNPGAATTGSIAADDYGLQSTSQKTYGFGADYGIGNVTLGAVYTHVNVGRATSSIYVGGLGTPTPDIRFDNVELNIKYDVTPLFFVGGMYTYTRSKVNQGGPESSLHWNQIGLMAQYSLSKRTALYSQLVYQKVSGGDDTILSEAYIPGSAGVSSNSHQTVARIAVTRSF